MLTAARIEQALRPAGLDWITALRGAAIQQLAQTGTLQFSLFDTRDMAEISSPDYPGERLVVCKNPLLAAERQRKRDELLALTEAGLKKIQARVARDKSPLRGAGEIDKAVGAVLGRRKMAKHFEQTIIDHSFDFARKAAAIAEEARLDGFYVLRTSLPAEQIDTAGTVRAYKSLAQVERAFRCMKTVVLDLPPVFHWTAPRARMCCCACWRITWSGLCARSWRRYCSTTMTGPRPWPGGPRRPPRPRSQRQRSARPPPSVSRSATAKSIPCTAFARCWAIWRH